MLTLSDDSSKIMGINNSFWGNVDLQAHNKYVVNDNKAFLITYSIRDNLEACIELIAQDWSSANVNVIELYNGST